jgi:ferredoxin
MQGPEGFGFGGAADQVATVRCEPSGREATVVRGTILMDAIHQLMLPLGQSCDGVALCGFCRVQVIDGQASLTGVTGAEKKVLDSLHAGEDERLACCARVEGDVTVTTTYW